MARILYGLCGEGNGHACRAKVVLDHLANMGHDVKLVVDGTARQHFEAHHAVRDIIGWEGVFQDQAIQRTATLRKNLSKILRKGLSTTKTLLEVIGQFNPEISITDYQPWVALASRLKGIPLISIDHQHVISNFFKGRYAISGDYLLARVLTNNNLARHYFITSFFNLPVREDRRYPLFGERYSEITTPIGPIIGNDVFHAKSSDEGLFLVYAGDQRTREKIGSVLNARGLEYACYPQERFSREDFLADLARSSAVLTTAGHNVISEALFLGKPLYVMPIAHHFEQQMNAFYVEQEGYGLGDKSPPSRLFEFVEKLDDFRGKIKKDHERFYANPEFFECLDRKIDELVGVSR